MKILFIADKFDDEPRDEVSNFPGGAELTDAAIIEASPFNIKKKKITELTLSELNTFDLLIIGNLKMATSDQLDYISSNTNYILFEHDMRICRYDGDFSRAKKEPIHYFLKKCICPHIYLKKLYRNARGAVFLTKKQYDVYKSNPFFKLEKMEILGSSAFNKKFFKRIEKLREKNIKRSGTSVFYSPHPVKGYEQSRDFCLDQGIKPNEIFNKTPEEVFDILERSEQFVYLPAGVEWAGRMPVEARFLGCEVIVNKNVGVAGEPWWGQSDDNAFDFVRDTADRFWRIVKKLSNENPD